MENIQDKIYTACKTGDINTVRDYIKNKDTLYANSGITNNSMIVNSIAGGQLEILQLLFAVSAPIKDFFNTESINLFSKESCDQNNVEILAYLLDYPLIVNNQYPHFIMKMGSYCAANGKLDCFKHICDNFLEDYYFNKNFGEGDITALAAQYGHLDVIDYILTNDNLQNFNTTTVINKSFKRAVENKNMKTLSYFIFNRNIEINPTIQPLIDKNKFVSDMFDSRTLKQSLTEELDKTQNNNKTTKIKI